MKHSKVPQSCCCSLALLLLFVMATTTTITTICATSPLMSNEDTNVDLSHMNGRQVAQVAALWRDLAQISDKSTSQQQRQKIVPINNKKVGDSYEQQTSSLQQQLQLSPTATNTTQIVQQSAIDSSEDDDDRSLILGVIIANLVIFVIGFCGNSLVILVILRFTRIETVTDIYILNLAFADLMFIFGLIFLIITMFIDHWIFGNLMCKLYMASTSLNQFASSLLLVVMSFDRFLAVCHPIYAQRFRQLGRAKVICLCIWVACLVLMTPILTFAKINKDLTCAIFWPEYKSFNCEMAFTMYSFAIGFAVPLLLIAAFYICVIRKLRMAATGPISLGSSRRSRSRESANKRIEHLVIGIICTYTICWLPYWITQLCVSFTTQLERSPIEGFYPLVLVATCLSYTNSALNPILYAFLSDNFKRRCTDVFRCIYSTKWCARSRHSLNGGAGAGGGAATSVGPPLGTNSSRPGINGGLAAFGNDHLANSTVATALVEVSEVGVMRASSPRPESRQTFVLNSSVAAAATELNLTAASSAAVAVHLMPNDSTIACSHNDLLTLQQQAADTADRKHRVDTMVVQTGGAQLNNGTDCLLTTTTTTTCDHLVNIVHTNPPTAAFGTLTAQEAV